MPNICATLPIYLPKGVWVQLGKLLAVVNYYNLTRGRKAITLPGLVGTLCTASVVELAQDTERKFRQIHKDVAANALPLFYSSEQLSLLTETSAAGVPNASRIAWKRNNGHARREARKALQCLTRRPASTVARPVTVANALRGRSGGVGAEAYLSVSNHLHALRTRTSSSGQGDT